MVPKIWDISPVISERTAVFPGDAPFRRKVAMAFSEGDHLTLSKIDSTLHIGAHVDAPSHYHPQGASIDRRSLAPYLGACQVIEVKLAPGERILPRHLADLPVKAPRVLFKTRSFPNPDLWNGDFNSLSPELVTHLADQGVVLIGIDTPSVDPAEDAKLESHRAIHARDLSNLEGIVLDDVAPGLYTLIALPLRLENADASPVRAVLVEGSLT